MNPFLKDAAAQLKNISPKRVGDAQDGNLNLFYTSLHITKYIVFCDKKLKREHFHLSLIFTQTTLWEFALAIITDVSR